MNSIRFFGALAATLLLTAAAVPAMAAAPTGAAGGYDNQRLQAQQQLAQTQSELAAVQVEEQDLDRQIAQTQETVAHERERARLLARALYVQPSSLLVMLAREPDPIASLQDAIQVEMVAAHARSATDRIQTLEMHLQELTQHRQTASERESRLKQALQLELIKNAGMDVWGRARAWLAANPDYRVDPPNPNHSKSPLTQPCPGAALTQPYGPTPAWFEPPFAGYPHFHTGIDLAAPTGTPVLAADDGVVIATGSDGYGYGNYLLLGHPGGRATLYGHLSKTFVKAGDKIAQGQEVALVGATGNSTGPHLHFEVLVDGLPVDPAPYLVSPAP